MSSTNLAEQAGKKVAVVLFKKVIKNILPLPGLGLAIKAVSFLEDKLEERERKKLEYLRKMEEKFGSQSVMDIGTVASTMEPVISGSVSKSAVMLVSEKNVCAWYSPNGLWVFHKNPKYRPSYRFLETKIYRPGRRLGDGTWNMNEEKA